MVDRLRLLDDPPDLGLERFAAYDDAYLAARMLDLAGERALALRLLSWLDRDGPLALPEVALTHAALLIRRAAPDAPWAAALDGVGEGRQHIVCETFDPLHTALYDPVYDPLAGQALRTYARFRIR